MAEKPVGRVIQVIGPVLDIQFEAGHLPALYNAVRIISDGYSLPQPLDVTVEVQQHLGQGRVRAVAIEPNLGMARGIYRIDSGRASGETLARSIARARQALHRQPG